MRGSDRLVLVALAWAVMLFFVALFFTDRFGNGLLVFAALPTVLTVVVYALLILAQSTGRSGPRIAAIVLSGGSMAVAMTSFLIPALAVIPGCAVLLAACLM